MKRQRISFLVLATLALAGALTACRDQSAAVVPLGNRFVRVYDNGRFDGTYTPLDVRQTADSGYLFLGAINDWEIYLTKVDQAGNFAWETKLPEPYVNALPTLYTRQGKQYFFCMDKTSLATYLLRLDPDSNRVAVEKTFEDLRYPLAASATADGGFLLQHYDRDERSTGLAKLDAGLGVSWRSRYNVRQDVEVPIVAHLTRTGPRLPFLTGTTSDGYFFNGFGNFTFSMVFVNPTDGKQTGVLTGFRNQAAASAAQHLGGNQFALTRYVNGDNYLYPTQPVAPAAIAALGDLPLNPAPELRPNAPVVIRRLPINGLDVVLFASETKSKQIVLFAYQATTNKLLGKHYLGWGNPYELGNVTATSDGGLAVLGRTYAAGRFPRNVLFKLSKEELTTFVQLPTPG